MNSLNTDPPRSNLPGDPNCPICHGIGFVRQDLPVDHPDFGRMSICTCRQKDAVISAQQRLFAQSNLAALSTMTFEAFKIEGRRGLSEQHLSSLRTARAQAQQFAATLPGWLVIEGGYGCGKTHLAAAIANHAVNLGAPTLFLTVPDLLDWMRFAYSDPTATFEQRFDEIRNVRLLVLDDLGTQNATAWAQEKLFQILDYRYLHRLPLVITTNLEPGDLDGRIRSRLQDATLVTTLRISAPDFRTGTNETEQSLLSTLNLLNDRTFGNFSMREPDRLSTDVQRSLEKSFRAAQEFAERPRGWLVLMGTYGCGKTHLAAAIGNYRSAGGEEPLFVVVPDLLDHLRAAFSPNSAQSYDRLFEEVRNAPLLILDDLSTQSATPWAREKLYQIINHRYNASLPMVITTASPLDEIDPRIQSRLLDSRLCKIYAILAPAYRAATAPLKRPRTTRSGKTTS